MLPDAAGPHHRHLDRGSMPVDELRIGLLENVECDLQAVPGDGPSILDPSNEELWEGSDAMKLDIPALDLDWGDLDEGEGAGPYA